MGEGMQNASKLSQEMQTGKTEPRKRLVLKVKPRPAIPEPSTSGEESESPAVDDNKAGHSIINESGEDEESASESESGRGIDGDGDDDDDNSSSEESDDDEAVDGLDDIFYVRSTQGVMNPIVKNATHATDDDWVDFFRLAANNGNKEILDLVKRADPSSTLNIKRVINMVFKGQGRLAKIRGVSLKVVRKGFHQAREINGVRERQQTIRKATMKKNGTGPKGRKVKPGWKGAKGVKIKDTKEVKTKNTPALDDTDEETTEPEKIPPVSNTISKREKSKEELEIEEAASILVKISSEAWKAENTSTPGSPMALEQTTRQEAAETLLLISRESRNFNSGDATYV